MSGAVLLNRMVWKSGTEKVLSEQRKNKEQARRIWGGRVFQAQGHVSAKVLSLERSAV